MPINNGGGASGITIELDPNSLPLSGGTLTGLVYVSEQGLRNPLNENFIIDSYNDTGAGTHNYFNFNPFGGGLELPNNSAGITFGDATVQTTAALPLTGGTLSAGLLVNAGDFNYDFGDIGLIINTPTVGFGLSFNDGGDAIGLSLSGTGNGITFPDTSVQTTAGLPLTGGSVVGVITIEGGAVNSLDIIDGGGIRFGADDSYQTTAYSPTAGNSGISQTGNMSHSDYSKEIQLVIGGVTYAIPARIIP